MTFTNRNKTLFLIVNTALQLLIAVMVGIGVWPREAAYLGVIVQMLFMWFLDLEHALYALILALPFYLALPLPGNDQFLSLRLIIVFFFGVFLYKRESSGTSFFAWDKKLFWLGLALLISTLLSDAQMLGFKKILFLLNFYLLYIIAANVLKEKAQIAKASWVTFISLLAFVLIGYVQYIAAFFTNIYYFWQYWAVTVSRAYYGSFLSDTLIYSNSWFSFSADRGASLRMFSVLPDSHSFAVLAMFLLPLASALLFFSAKKWQKTILWVSIVLSGLAIVLSGTRGVWVALLAPLIVLAVLYVRRYGRKLVLAMLAPLLIFIACFLATPFIHDLTASLKGQDSANYLSRVGTIYDWEEESNSGRLYIWRETLENSKDNFLFGAGFGNFASTLPADQEVIERRFNLPPKYITAHSLYLDFLAEAGILGLLALLFYFKDILVEHWKYFRSRYLYDNDGFVFLACSIGAYMLALFTYSLVDGTLLNDRVLVYFFLLLSISGNIMRQKN